MSLLAAWLAQGLDHLLPQTQTVINIGARMALTDEALADLDTATNEVAARLDELADQIETVDAGVAAQIRTRAERLRTLAADPANPVPEDPEPAPEG